MKKIITFISIISFLAITSGFAQEQNDSIADNTNDSITDNTSDKMSKENQIVLSFNIYSDVWQDAPDNMNIRTINQGTDICIMYNTPFGKSNFSFSVGLGIGSHNLHSDAIPAIDTANATIFSPIADSISYDKNKLTVAYLDIPVEFIFKVKNKNDKSFKIALGFKAGRLINSHTTYKGDDYLFGTEKDLNVKFQDIKNINLYRYGITGKIGYEWINVMIYYSLTNLFKKDKGPEMYPISVGISFTSF